MKWHQERKFIESKHGLHALFLVVSLGLAGCGGGNVEQQRAQQAQELGRLKDENKEVLKLRTENKDLPRLRKEHDELPQLRGYAEEIEKLRKDNERIRAEIADAAKSRRDQAAQRAQQAAAAARQAGAGVQAAQGGITATNVVDPNIPQESDEILIDPRFLAKILPQFDWAKLDRKEPLAVRALLEQQGITLTNYQQLIALGITNYVIQHGARPPAAPAAPAP